eukprot:6117225-Amphidinium_carterae.1
MYVARAKQSTALVAFGSDSEVMMASAALYRRPICHCACTPLIKCLHFLARVCCYSSIGRKQTTSSAHQT